MLRNLISLCASRRARADEEHGANDTPASRTEPAPPSARPGRCLVETPIGVLGPDHGRCRASSFGCRVRPSRESHLLSGGLLAPLRIHRGANGAESGRRRPQREADQTIGSRQPGRPRAGIPSYSDLTGPGSVEQWFRWLVAQHPDARSLAGWGGSLPF